MSDDEPDVPTDGEADPDSENRGNGECFVIAPIGSPKSDTRNQTNGLLDEAIRPIVEEELGLEVIAPHEIAEAGSITRQVIQRLLEAELVIADLTGLNANVMYEFAVRHAKGEPVVPIAEKGTSLPFDITTERTIFYEESFHGLNKLKPRLKDAARAALDDEEPDNPIYRAQQDFQMREAVAGDDKMEYVMDRLDDIEGAINDPGLGSSGQSARSSTYTVDFLIEGDDVDTSAFEATLTEKSDLASLRGPFTMDIEKTDLGAMLTITYGNRRDRVRLVNLVQAAADQVGLEADEIKYESDFQDWYTTPDRNAHNH